MPDREYESNAERQKAYRERKAREEADREYEARLEMPVPDLVAAARAGTIELSSLEEQRIRDHFGYAPSEQRTLAERDGTAKRILERVQLTPEEKERLQITVTLLEDQEAEHRQKVEVALRRSGG